MMGWLPALTRLFPASYWQGSKVEVMQVGTLHANQQHLCWPGTTPRPWDALALAHRRDPPGFRAFQTKGRATSTRTQREVEGKKAKLSGPDQHSKTAAERWSRSNNNREAKPGPSLDGYRQETRTFLSVQLKKMWCSPGQANQSERLCLTV